MYPVILKQFPYMYQPTDGSQYAYNLECRRNEHQPALTPVSNIGLYCLNSKIRDDCKFIPKRLRACLIPTSLTLILPILASSVSAYNTNTSNRAIISGTNTSCIKTLGTSTFSASSTSWIWLRTTQKTTETSQHFISRYLLCHKQNWCIC